MTCCSMQTVTFYVKKTFYLSYFDFLIFSVNSFIQETTAVKFEILLNTQGATVWAVSVLPGQYNLLSILSSS
jgi:hypothetical protein